MSQRHQGEAPSICHMASTSMPPQDAHETPRSGRVSTITFFVVKPYIINPLLHEQTWGSARAMMGWVLFLWEGVVTKGRLSSLGEVRIFYQTRFQLGHKKTTLNLHHNIFTEPSLALAYTR